MSWCRVPLWDLRPDITYYRNVAVLNLRSCFCGAPSLTRGRVCNLQCNRSMVRAAQNPTVSSETPPTWRAKFPYLYPPGTGWPRYAPLTTRLLLKPKSKSHYNWPSVSHYVKVSSPFRDFRVRVRVTLRLTVCQSVRLGVEPTLGLTTKCYFPLEVWCLKFSGLSLFGRPLWREVGSAICQSKSVVVCQGKIHIYISCEIYAVFKCPVRTSQKRGQPVNVVNCINRHIVS
jgi:hypothetical protein